MDAGTWRGVIALTGVILFLVGLTVTLFTMVVNGWAVIAGIGVALCALDLIFDGRQATR